MDVQVEVEVERRSVVNVVITRGVERPNAVLEYECKFYGTCCSMLIFIIREANAYSKKFNQNSFLKARMGSTSKTEILSSL